MAGERRITPVAVPTWVAAWLDELASLRSDFREHAANDNRDLGRIRESVGELAVETGKQSVTLARIEQQLARRAKTEDAEHVIAAREASQKRLRVWSALWKVIAVLAGVAGGALLHKYIG